MGIKVEVLPLDVNTPGQARLRISGWNGASEGLVFCVQSSQSREFLQPAAQWSNVAHWFTLDAVVRVEEADALETRIGPDLLDPLLAASSNANFRVELSNPSLGQTDVGMMRFDKSLVASIAGVPGKAPEPVAPAPVPAAEPEPAAAEPLVETAATPEPVPAAQPSTAPAPATKNRWLLPLALLLVLLAVAGGAGWWWFTQQPKPTAEVAEVVAAEQPCTLESMQSQAELAFVQSCMQKAPDSAALLEVITLAKANDKCAVAQRLYANRAQSGDIQIATAYAHEYDPKFHQPSECFKAPDNATAAYWYETILGFDENNALAKQRFEELK